MVIFSATAFQVLLSGETERGHVSQE